MQTKNKKKILIVAGDSWSIDNFYDQLNIEFYPPYNSLSRQLQTACPDYIVTSWAEQGSSIISQTQRICRGLHKNQADVTVLLSWTDWSRCFNFNHITGRGKDTSLPRSYATARSQAIGFSQRAIDSIPSWVRVLHWGGHSEVPKEIVLPPNHHLLYRDYCAQVFGDPSNTTGTLTYYMPTLKLFPNTSKMLAERIDCENTAVLKHRTKKGYTWYPDGGHLSWHLYKDLIQTTAKYLHEDV